MKLIRTVHLRKGSGGGLVRDKKSYGVRSLQNIFILAFSLSTEGLGEEH